MKKLLLQLLALAFIASPAEAKLGPGRLDPTFGRDGKVTTLLRQGSVAKNAPSAWLAWGPGGKILAAVDNTLLEYLSNGRLNRNFGVNGRLAIAAPSGMTLQAAGMAVDSRGRILVAGTVRPTELTASVLVTRYLLQGRLDRSFGNGGGVITDLGLPAPTPPRNKALEPIPTITEPVVEASGLAVDRADRPVLTGSWISGYSNCYPFITETRQDRGYVARINVDGSIDSRFGGGVLSPDPSKELWFSPLVDARGVLSMGRRVNCLRGGPLDLRAAQIDEEGRLDESFGSAGQIVLPSWYEAPALARDRYGRLLLLAEDATGQKPLLIRLRRNGSPDRRFGGAEGIELPFGISALDRALGTDHRGRPIVASTEGDSELGWWLQVSRRRRDGDIDHSFGRRGKVSTHFPNEIHARQILVGGGGKILVGSVYLSGSKKGVALARYLGG
jgi:uncharacterized delta-60 repeat protein